MATKLALFLVINIIISITAESDDTDVIKTDLLRSSERIDAIDKQDHTEVKNEEFKDVKVVSPIDSNENLKNEDISTTETIDMTDSDVFNITTDVTNTVTESISVESNVYKLAENIHSVNSNVIEGKAELSTSTTPTTKMVDEMEPLGPGIAAFDDERDLSPRVPKLSDNSEPKQQDKRNFDLKPHPEPEQALSKCSTLKGWLQDSFLRPPAGILVPLRPMALNRALAVWNDLTVDGLGVTDLVIVGYDANGVNWRSRHNLQPTSKNKKDRTVGEALSKLILKYQDVNTDANTDGTMRALASAAKLVPYDSALFVVTDKGPGDSQRLPLALRALVEKRLKVYTIWTDPSHPSNASELQLQSLRNISKHTEGGVLPYSFQVMDMDSSSGTDLNQWEAMKQPRKGRVHPIFEEDNMDTLLVRRGGGEAISLGVPVENGVSALRIYIEGLVEHAVLYPPNDAPQIDLYNMTSVMMFSPKSRTEGLSPRDVYLVFPGADPEAAMLSVLPVKPTLSEAPAPTVGVWHLSVRCDTCDYRLCVTAHTQIHFYAEPQPRDMLKIRVLGPVASVRESMLIDEYGTELAKLPFSYQPITSDGLEASAGRPTEVIADVQLPSVKGSKVYAKIVGRDIRGEPFTRLCGPIAQEVRMGRSASISFPGNTNDLQKVEDMNNKAYSQRLQYNDSNVLPFNRAVSQVVNQRGTLLTAVQIGLSSRLYGAPGDTILLHFEVTNYREQSVRFTFEARGELRFLRGINPTSQRIDSGQTANVIVTVGITPTAQPGARDLITFTAYGLEQVSISAYVYVQNPGQTPNDIWSPEVRHNFQGSCIGRQGSDCAQHVWSATIIARDAVGGLLRVTSSPIGLTYDSNFISGTREEVISTYRATCCAPRVMITAVDAFGNANSYVVDISNYFTSAAIAAIVLGVFLFIALVAVIVFIIYWCVKRRRESAELPYTASSRRYEGTSS